VPQLSVTYEFRRCLITPQSQLWNYIHSDTPKSCDLL
jgi:hypothetical protein